MPYLFATSVCHRDIDQLIRQARWVKHLQGFGHPPALPKLVLGYSKKAEEHTLFDEMMEAATAAWPDLHTFLVHPCTERGWPHSASCMFRHLLAECERIDKKAHVFFFEPDCVPLKPTWAADLIDEFRTARKGRAWYCGGLVEFDEIPPHMTGIAWYGAGSLKRIEGLDRAEEGPTGAWDVDFSPQFLKSFTPSTRIVHQWHRTEDRIDYTSALADPSVLANIPEAAVIFHQDKAGTLMRQLSDQFPGFIETPPDSAGATFEPFVIAINLNSLHVAKRIHQVKGITVLGERIMAGIRRTHIQINTLDQAMQLSDLPPVAAHLTRV